MKFKLDENIPKIMKKILQDLGYLKVSTIQEEKKAGIDDMVLANLCEQEEKVLVTLDHDFLDINKFKPTSKMGYIILEPLSQGKKEVSELFYNFQEKYQLTKVKGKTLKVTTIKEGEEIKIEEF
ncbi:MAG: DUF5615 family PIN-like protein [Candidatus Kariarchaeaceae archaeon]